MPIALTVWQYLIELGHEKPNSFQPEGHRPVPLKDATVRVNGAVGRVLTSQFNWRSGRVLTSSPWHLAGMSRSCANCAPINSSTNHVSKIRI